MSVSQGAFQVAAMFAPLVVPLGVLIAWGWFVRFLRWV